MKDLVLHQIAKSVCMLAVLAVVGTFGLSATAAPMERLIGPGALLINGQPVNCGRTPALISKRYPDFGAARPGLIILNPERLRPLPPAARLLIYYHECAHQFVGRNELAADCWAVQKARRDGRLSRVALLDACTFIKALPANKHHPPGVMRCRHMMRCYDETYRARAKLEKPRQSKKPDGPAQASGFSRPASKFPPMATSSAE